MSLNRSVSQAWLDCFDEESAQRVVDFCADSATEGNFAAREDTFVTLTYTDKAWAYRVSEMAEASRLASQDRLMEFFGCIL